MQNKQNTFDHGPWVCMPWFIPRSRVSQVPRRAPPSTEMEPEAFILIRFTVLLGLGDRLLQTNETTGGKGWQRPCNRPFKKFRGAQGQDRCPGMLTAVLPLLPTQMVNKSGGSHCMLSFNSFPVGFLVNYLLPLHLGYLSTPRRTELFPTARGL